MFTPAGIRILEVPGRSCDAIPAIASRLTKLKCSCAENCGLLGCYAAFGSFIPTFRDNLSVPSSRVKKMGTMMCLQMSVPNYQTL